MSTRAGIPISVSVDRLKNTIKTKSVTRLAEQLVEGKPIAESFAETGEFSPFEINLISVGVQTARLEDIFAHLTTYWSQENQLGATLMSQAFYPFIIAHVAVFLSALPQIVDPDGGIIYFIFAILYNGFILYFFTIPVAVLAIYTWHSELGQKFWGCWPLIGTALRSVYIFRWITAVRLEFAAGIGLPQAVADAWRSSGFVGSEEFAVQAEAAIQDGNPLSHLLRNWSHFPPDWADFVDSGERAGSLETTFDTLADEASRTAAAAQDRLRVWLPRLVFVFLMIFVGYFFLKALFGFLAPISKLFSNLPTH